jgi:hypothetical protein
VEILSACISVLQVPGPGALSSHGSSKRREAEDIRLEFASQIEFTLRQLPGFLCDIDLVDYHMSRSELQPDVGALAL